MRRRLVVSAVVSVALALLPVTAVFYAALSRLLEADARTLLAARAAAAIASESASTRSAPVESTGEAVLDASTWLLDGAGRLLERPTLGAVPDDVAVRFAGVDHPTFRTVGDVLLLAVPLGKSSATSRPGTSGAVVVASLSRLPYEHAERAALMAALVLDAVVLLVMAAITWRSVSAALAPVASMTADAAEWGAHDVQRRFALGPARDELTGLAATLDDLLERLALSLSHERRLTAEIAHELRTPLARIRAEAEVAVRGRRSSPELRAVLHDVASDTAQLAHTIDTLLYSAAAHDDASGQCCDPTEVLAQALATAGELDPTTRFNGWPAAGLPPLAVGAAQALQALSPVMDNAARYGRGVVTVTARRVASGVEFEIRDNGPGFTDGEHEEVFAPGTRGSAASTNPGVGLGLPLARRMARAAGGDVTAHHSPDGGLVRVHLPTL